MARLICLRLAALTNWYALRLTPILGNQRSLGVCFDGKSAWKELNLHPDAYKASAPTTELHAGVVGESTEPMVIGLAFSVSRVEGT